MRSICRWYLAVLTASSLLVAQAPVAPEARPAPPEAVPPTGPVYSVGVRNVLAPTVVIGRDGSYINDLKPADFRLYDNGRLQDSLAVVTAELPIDIVVAIQANYGMEKILPKLKNIGSLLEGEVLGERGEAQIVAFSSSSKVIQPWTHDGRKIAEAISNIHVGTSQSAMLDAVESGVRMLRNRPMEHRKIVLLIGETRDSGSTTNLRETLSQLEFAGVTVYTVNISRLITQITGRAMPPRPDSIPTAARAAVLPPGAPATPLSVEQTLGVPGSTAMTFVPMLKEIFLFGKSKFTPVPATVLTRYTGGGEFEFMGGEHGLEKAFAKLSSELHLEYLLSFNPTSREGGYHEIVVQVSRPNLEVRTRPGYWYGGEAPVAR